MPLGALVREGQIRGTATRAPLRELEQMLLGIATRALPRELLREEQILGTATKAPLRELVHAMQILLVTATRALPRELVHAAQNLVTISRAPLREAMPKAQILTERVVGVAMHSEEVDVTAATVAGSHGLEAMVATGAKTLEIAAVTVSRIMTGGILLTEAAEVAAATALLHVTIDVMILETPVLMRTLEALLFETVVDAADATAMIPEALLFSLTASGCATIQSNLQRDSLLVLQQMQRLQSQTVIVLQQLQRL